MKALNRSLCALTVALLLASAGQVLAQSQLSGPDGMAASPKFRQLMWQQQRVAVVPEMPNLSTQPAYAKPAEITASPKLHQMMSEFTTSGVAQDTGTVPSYRATGPDGITASPKLRQQLDEQSMQFQIAPLK
jgi:hypothetical protein